MYIVVHSCGHVGMHVCTCMYMYVCMYVCMYVYGPRPLPPLGICSHEIKVVVARKERGWCPQMSQSKSHDMTPYNTCVHVYMAPLNEVFPKDN